MPIPTNPLQGTAYSQPNDVVQGGSLLSSVVSPLVGGIQGGVGYVPPSANTVTQLTNKSTGVTLNAYSGTITMNNASLANATAVAFTLTNSAIGASDVVVCALKSGNTASSYILTVDATALGSCKFNLYNFTGGSLSEAVVFNFAVIKGSFV
jgi:hypothetical protein